MNALVCSMWTHDENWADSKAAHVAKLREEYAAQQRKTVPSFKMDMGYGKRYREIYIHSKLMIIDDSMFTLGSANLNTRSMNADSEINIASDDPHLSRDLRERVWGLQTAGAYVGGSGHGVDVEKTFEKWKSTAVENLEGHVTGLQPTCFLTAFHDKRTSSVIMG